MVAIPNGQTSQRAAQPVVADFRAVHEFAPIPYRVVAGKTATALDQACRRKNATYALVVLKRCFFLFNVVCLNLSYVFLLAEKKSVHACMHVYYVMFLQTLGIKQIFYYLGFSSKPRLGT